MIDHYLAQDDVREMLTRSDLDDYQKLVRSDIVMRAGNLFLMGDFSGTAQLLNGFFNYDMLAVAMRDKRSLSVFLLSFYLKMTNVSGLRRCGQAPLRKLKRVSRK